MRKIFLATVLVVASFIGANAQSGNNQIGIGVDLGLPIGGDDDWGGNMKLGFGGSVKGLLGVGSAGQVTLTTGFSTFSAKDDFGGSDVKTNIIPVLAGYRHNFSGFYVEPQAGLGMYKLKVLDESESKSAFTYAVGIGYALNGLDISARYQGSKVSDWDMKVNLIGFRVGYNFSLGGASAKK